MLKPDIMRSAAWRSVLYGALEDPQQLVAYADGPGGMAVRQYLGWPIVVKVAVVESLGHDNVHGSSVGLSVCEKALGMPKTLEIRP
ncbi:MAG TPA: hypothetical protein DDW52_19600 [Planctomycetaceae bacterium]|nr:hypothetical protein [Planctomycetaceae bacterium]